PESEARALGPSADRSCSASDRQPCSAPALPVGIIGYVITCRRSSAPPETAKMAEWRWSAVAIVAKLHKGDGAMNREGQEMGRNLYAVAAAGTLLITIAGAEPALAQKSGGVLKIYHRDSPASMSILEEATNSTEIPMMGVFNNLVLYKQDVAQNSLQ